MGTMTTPYIEDIKDQAPKDTEKVLDVALYLIYLAKKDGKRMNATKLQKLLYYCQAWHLAHNDKKLFDNEVEAWVHGGVVPALYFYLQKNSVDIQDVYKQIDDEDVEYLGTLSEKDKENIEWVFEQYGGYSAFDLEYINHHEEPWQKAREGLDEDQLSRTVIDTDLMKKFYKAKEKKAASVQDPI